MNRSEIEKMEAGQETDLLIAKDVLGLSTDEWNSRFFAGRARYSTDISAAWEVVEKMKHFVLYKYENDCWECEYDGQYLDCAEAPTAPLAICRAALLAIESK